MVRARCRPARHALHWFVRGAILKRPEEKKIKLLPRVDASEVPTDSDQTIPDVPATEPPTVPEMVRRWRDRPKRETPEPARSSFGVVFAAIALAAAVILGALLLTR